MHITVKEIEAYLEKQARQFNKNHDNLSTGDKFAAQHGIAVMIIWDLIMDLDPDIRARRIKTMKVKA